MLHNPLHNIISSTREYHSIISLEINAMGKIVTICKEENLGIVIHSCSRLSYTNKSH